MQLDLNAVEWFWLSINALALGFQVLSLWWAWDRRTTVRRLNGHAREIVASGDVRREVLRVIVQLLFIGIAIPSIFSANEIRLTPPLVCLLIIPILVCLNSALDARDTFRLVRIADEQVENDRVQTLARIEDAINRQTEATVAAIGGARDEDVTGHRKVPEGTSD